MSNDNASAHPADRCDAEVRRVIPFYDVIQTETLDLVGSFTLGPIPRSSLWLVWV